MTADYALSKTLLLHQHGCALLEQPTASDDAGRFVPHQGDASRLRSHMRELKRLSSSTDQKALTLMQSSSTVPGSRSGPKGDLSSAGQLQALTRVGLVRRERQHLRVQTELHVEPRLGCHPICR